MVFVIESEADSPAKEGSAQHSKTVLSSPSSKLLSIRSRVTHPSPSGGGLSELRSVDPWYQDTVTGPGLPPQARQVTVKVLGCRTSLVTVGVPKVTTGTSGPDPK